MAINIYLSSSNLKNKLSKQAEQKQNHRYGEYWNGDQLGEDSGGVGKKVKGLTVQIGSYRIVIGI